MRSRSELGVAEDSTLGKFRLYKATPTPVMWSLLPSLSKLSFPPTPIFTVSGDGLHSQATSFSIVLTHPFITWTIFLLIVLSRPTFPLFSPLSDNPHSVRKLEHRSYFSPSPHYGRSLFSYLPLHFPSTYCLIDSILPLPLCSLWPVL